MNRPPIPRPLKRDVLVEAGHRCAIPTCRAPTLDIAHIVPWSEGQKHSFDNLIALCPNCNRRYDRDEIDRASMRRYKANLTIVNGRYGDLERRVLEAFATLSGGEAGTSIVLPKSLGMLMMYLVGDGLVEGAVITAPEGIPPESVAGTAENQSTVYRLTEKGSDFVQRWLRADELG